MSIASRCAFPNKGIVGLGEPIGYSPGMSYRHWLIGQALSGLGKESFESSDSAAAVAIARANAVIARLDAEK
jgi:hypothetical protein